MLDCFCGAGAVDTFYTVINAFIKIGPVVGATDEKIYVPDHRYLSDSSCAHIMGYLSGFVVLTNGPETGVKGR